MTVVNPAATSEAPRIALGWSAATVAELRRAATGAAPGWLPIECALSPALLLAAEGDFRQAEAHVLQVMQQHAEPDRLRDPLFFPFFLALFVIQHFDLASRMLKEGWQLDCAIELRTGAPSPGPHRVRLEMVSSSRVRFAFDDSALSQDITKGHILSFCRLFPLFADYLKRGVEATGSVDVSLWDGGLGPGLAFCSNQPEHFLIPDNLFVASAGYEPQRCAYRENDVPWGQRHPIAVWRGGTAGHPLDREIGWRSLPRIRLCELAQQHSDLMDAGITAVTQILDPAASTAIRESGWMRSYMPPTEFNRYKYQIDIDGNTNSWPGLFLKLLTGSPVLKVASPSGLQQWYYDRLRPWINFVPVTADMSDLADKLRWLRQHDDAAHAIGERGQALALSMDYEGELKRAGRTITAALRYFAGQPETELRFGLEEAGNACLLDGWLPPLKDGVAGRDFESRLRLPRPVAADDFMLSLELSPAAEALAPVPQRVVVVVNGAVLLASTLTERQIVHCTLSRRTIMNDEAVLVTLLHPDARIAASAAHPLDGRMVSVVLHRLSLTAAWAHAAQYWPARPPRSDGEQSASPETHAQANPAALGGPSKKLLTHHGTVVFADVAVRLLRHGPLAVSPANVHLAADGQTAYLLYQGPDGTQRPVSVRPAVGPPQTGGPNHDGDAPPGEFRVVNAEGSAFGLARDGLFLCAESSGSVTLSRRQLGPWERFHTIDP